MAKRTRKRYTRSEKDHLGCISGLISIFDFRQGRATRRLISDRRCGNCEKHVGTVHSSVKPTLRTSCDLRPEVSNTGVSTLLDGDESNNAEMGAMSVKILMDEEMSKEQKPKKKLPNFSHLQTRKGLEHRGCIEEYLKHANKKSNLDPQPNMMEVYLLIEEFFNGSHYHLEITPAQESFNTQPVQKHSILEERLGEAMETFLNHKFVEAKQLNKGGALHQSKEFKDALEILNANKDLFLELLQDPNSVLLKHIQDLRNSQGAKLSKTESFNELVVGPELSEQETHNSIESNREIISENQFQTERGHYKFFGRKDKLKDKSSTKGSDSCHISSGRIELLKPSPSSSQSHFSLLDIKRKIKNAIGESRKERHWIFMDRTSHKHHSSMDSVEVSHQNETIAKVSIDLLAGDKSEKIKEHKSLQREPSIYKEAKKHLEEMLKVGEGDEDLSAKRIPSTLGTILSSPEYNILSPRLSPGKGKELIPGTEQLRFSPNDSNSECSREHVWQVKAECPSNDLSPLSINGQEGHHPYAGLQDSNFNSNFEDGFVENTTEESNSIRGCISPKAMEIKEVRDVIEQSNLFDVASEPDSSDVIEENVEEGSTECTRQIPCEENSQLLSIPEDFGSPSFIHNTESPDTIYKELERQSPVSVLEPLFLDVDTSPTSHVTRQDESPIQPRRIHFDEHESSPLSETGMDREINARAHLAENERKSEYIRTVLVASDLSCDEFKRGWNSTDQPLDPSSFDGMEAQSNQLSDDRKLLFCVVNEIILDIHERLFGCSSWVSFFKPRMQPIPVGIFFAREVMEGVDWYLLTPWPRTLDQTVEKDLAKDWTWMDHCFDAEEIGCDAVDAILDKLMEEMILELWD